MEIVFDFQFCLNSRSGTLYVTVSRLELTVFILFVESSCKFLRLCRIMETDFAWDDMVIKNSFFEKMLGVTIGPWLVESSVIVQCAHC